jgi:hypothetical protein
MYQMIYITIDIRRKILNPERHVNKKAIIWMGFLLSEKQRFKEGHISHEETKGFDRESVSRKHDVWTLLNL